MEDVEDDDTGGRSVIPAHFAGLESCADFGDSVLEKIRAKFKYVVHEDY